jgi:hypothetical protein
MRFGRDTAARGRLCGFLLALLGMIDVAQGANEVAVEVVNASVPTLCAETDNVYLKLSSSAVRRFEIEAVHPAYAGTIVVDSYAPDFTNCDMSNDPSYPSTPRRVTLFENFEWQLVGHTFPSFWRPNQVPVRIGDRTETGLHLLQLWTRYQERAEEVLVLYPVDGYWRARPLPPAHLRWSAYGSSFLMGPVETDGRPFVDIRSVDFDPETRSFTLAFARGGTATLRLEKLDQSRIVLDVGFEAALDQARPFAALRSMYVTDGNADVSQVAWREKSGKSWLQAPVMDFKQAQATELWAGRTVPSRHNTSAPDMVFRNFRGAR